MNEKVFLTPISAPIDKYTINFLNGIKKFSRMRISLQNEAPNQKIKQGGIIYSINEKEKSVSVISIETNQQEIIIPRSIKQESNEYDVICILSFALKNSEVKSLEFAKDSNLKTIEKAAFFGSHIESITIPSKVIDLKEGWCCYTPFLDKIKVSPLNQRYFCCNEQMILGKTSIESNEYDSLVFCVRNIKKATIPTFIKQIESYAFAKCTNLQVVEIPEKSMLEKINLEAFKSSSIEKIKIPSQLKVIGESSFADCKELRIVEIPEKSNLEIIDKEAFKSSSIEKFSIPSQLKVIGERSFSDCKKLQRIDISSNSQLKIIEKGAFSSTPIMCFLIPPNVSTICQNSFLVCQKLQIIEIDENSKIKVINYKMFRYCQCLRLMIPTKLSNFIQTKFDDYIFNINEFEDKYLEGKLFL